TRFVEATVCGMSSSFRQITVVPAFTVRACGAKVKLSIFTIVSAYTAPDGNRIPAARAATRRATLGECRRHPERGFCMTPVTVQIMHSSILQQLTRSSLALTLDSLIAVAPALPDRLHGRDRRTRRLFPGEIRGPKAQSECSSWE